MRVLSVRSHGRDCNHFEYKNTDTGTEKECHGYVPEGLGFGDYGDDIEFELDLDTGLILNWQPLSEEAILEILEQG